MINVWEAILLGFVQGATEFLPVSSSGHLVIAQALLGLDLPGISFEIAVHLATLVSIVLVYRTRITDLTTGALSGDREAWEYIGLVSLATLPVVVVGLLWRDEIESLFDAPVVPGVALLVTGLLLWSSRSALERAVAERPTWLYAFVIGVAQAFALVPGISRSGTTVVVAMWLGLQAREAAAFSFLMAIPAVGGAAVLLARDLSGGALDAIPTVTILAGSLAAGITGVLAIRTFVAMLARRSFHFFAPYCWIVGAAYLFFVFSGRG